MALKVYGVGRIASDIKLEKTNSGVSVLKIAIAFNAGYGDFQRTDFMNCVFWKGSAEAITKYCKKGDRLFIEGEIQTSQWEKDGVKRYATDVVVSGFEFIESRKQESQNDSIDDEDMPY